MQGRQRLLSMGTVDQAFATVLICTHNRATFLENALNSLARMQTTFSWELLVVDNGSTDGTAELLRSRAPGFPVPLRHLYEPRLGKSIALNAGIASAAGSIVVFGDDDQEFPPDWVERSCAPLVADPTLGYTGGRVLPLVSTPFPGWIDLQHSEYRSPLGVFDYGSDPFIFEERQRVAGGGNMAVRRTLLEQVGGFREDLGRRGRSLLGQEQAEFFSRTRALGARGAFVPEMRVWHHVPPDRLRKRYFVRWWFWKGIGHARWHAISGRTEYGLDLAGVPRLAGIPRFVFGESGRALLRAMIALVRWADASVRLLPILRLAYLAGYAFEARTRLRREAASGVGDLRPSGES